MVVALDGSKLAETILPVVSDWCTHLDLAPRLLEVFPARVPLERGEHDDRTSAYVRHVADQLGLRGFRAGWDTTYDRDPAEAIARPTETHTLAIIALSTRGRTGLDRILTRSVAMAVAHKATSPVLVLHPSGEAPGSGRHLAQLGVVMVGPPE
jgi:nucleotide-binding universal stress UspA family protein